MVKGNGSNGAINYNSFIDTIESHNTKKVVKSLQELGNYDYSKVSPIDIENIIINMRPNSPKAITTICYVLGLYAKYLGNNDMYHMVNDIDRRAVWLVAKQNAPKKFISRSQFLSTCKDVELYEEYNSLYISTLFRCIYEGIYSDDMSVIKNLRASDVNENMVALREDSGKEHSLEVSDSLARDLIKLGSVNTWSRNNRYGECKIKITGLYRDSCFKVENRKGSSEYSYRFTYYRILRKISKDYLERNLLPLQLFVSGIMFRIGTKLRELDIGIESAFAIGNKDRVVAKIISDELERCNCDTEVRNFREMVNGHLDVFIDKAGND